MSNKKQAKECPRHMSNSIFKSKVARNGQIVIPKDVRDMLGLTWNDSVTFEIEQDANNISIVLLKKTKIPISSLIGKFQELTPTADEEL